MPSKEDFEQFVAFVDKFKTTKTIGAALMAKVDDWYSDYYDEDPTDEFGFGLYPSGYLSGTTLSGLGSKSLMWTSTAVGTDRAFHVVIGPRYAVAFVDSTYEDFQLVVRCVKDAE